MSIATRFVSSTARPRLDLKGCVFYAPLWRPDLGGSTFTSIGDGGIPTHLCTVTGATHGIQGRTFGGADFINIDSVIASLASTTTGTWIIWAKLTDATPASSQTLICFGDADQTTTVRIRVNTNGTFIVDCYLLAVEQWTFSSDSALISDDLFFQVALVQDGVSPTLCFNGQSAAITYSNQTDKTAWFSVLSGLDTGRLGCRNSSGLGNGLFLIGAEGDVLLQNRNLTAQEIQQVYLSTKGRYV